MSTISAILYTKFELANSRRNVTDSRDAVSSARPRSHAARPHDVEVHRYPTAPEWRAGRGAGGRGGRAEAIYRCIFDAVVDHRLPPGAKLAEEQLGAIFRRQPHDRAQRAAGARPRSHRHDRAPSRRLRLGADGRRRAGHLFQPQGAWNRAIAREVGAADQGGGHRAPARACSPRSARRCGAATARRRSASPAASTSPSPPSAAKAR